jgi:outer membrane protein
LVQLLELDSTDGFRPERPAIATVPDLPALLDADAIYSVALKTQPEIKGIEFRRRASEKSLAAARGTRYPRLFVSGNFNTNYSSSNKSVAIEYPGTFTSRPIGYTGSGDTVFQVTPDVLATYQNVSLMDQFRNNRGSGLGVTMQVPIFNNWTARTTVARSRIALEQTRLNEEITRNNLYKSVQQAVLDAISARRKYDAASRSVESLRESATFSRQRFELGLINTYEYAVSVNNLARGEADQLQAKYDYLFRLKLLDFYQGKPLTF